MKCKKCGKQMKIINKKEAMADLDDDATDGQQADYMAAVESGDLGAWAITTITYECQGCGCIIKDVE